VPPNDCDQRRRAERCIALLGRHDIASDYREIGGKRSECDRRQYLRPTRPNKERQEAQRKTCNWKFAIAPPVRIKIGAAQCNIENQRYCEENNSRKNVAAMLAMMKICKVDLAIGRRLGCNERAKDVLDDRERYYQQHCPCRPGG
jgi:hypothetical protein